MQAWLQSADLSHRDFEADADGAIRTLSSHDWDAETALSKRLESEGKESCPAGLGLVRKDGQILHVCPEGGSAVVHWHRPMRVLGFLWKQPSVRTWVDIPLSSIPTAIRNFYDENDLELEQLR
jgi:hypothetical protein